MDSHPSKEVACPRCGSVDTKPIDTIFQSKWTYACNLCGSVFRKYFNNVVPLPAKKKIKVG